MGESGGSEARGEIRVWFDCTRKRTRRNRNRWQKRERGGSEVEGMDVGMKVEEEAVEGANKRFSPG